MLNAPTIRQEDLFGVPTTRTEARSATRTPTKVRWLPASEVGRLGVTKALQVLQVPRKTGQSALADWRDEMARRRGMSTAGFRRWVDLQVNIYGNRSLAEFIWAVA